MRFAVLAVLLVACGGGSLSPGSDDRGGVGSGGSAAAGSGGSAAAGSGDSAAAGSAGLDDDPDPALGAEQRAALEQLSPATLPALPTDVTNRWADDADAARFGQVLFFDPRFSGALLDGDNDGSPTALGFKGDTGKVACASCHVPTSGFSDSRTLLQQISLGSGWGLRRAPSLLDVARSKLLMWDGRRDSLFSQVFGPLESAVEGNSSRLFAAQRIFENHRASYESLFGPLPPLDDPKRFPPLLPEQTGCRALDRDNACVGTLRGAPGDGAEFDGLSPADQDAVTRVWVNVGKALGAYERLLSCGSSRFDAWIGGDDGALDRAEQRGAGLFVGKAHCVDCHSGPFLSDEKFHNVGLQPQLVATVFIDSNDPGASVGLNNLRESPLNSRGVYSDGDDGRIPAAATDLDLGAFRTPRLRCVEGRPSYMHTGQLRTLAEVVDFFDRGGDKFGFTGHSELEPLGLSSRERADLVAFLTTLTGAGPAAELLAPP